MRFPWIFRQSRPIPSLLARDDPIAGILDCVAEGNLRLPRDSAEIEELRAVVEAHLPLSPQARIGLDRILVSDRVRGHLVRLYEIGVLQLVFPDVVACVDIPHMGKGIRNVFEHLLETCRLIAPVQYMRLAALLHDVGKPETLGLTDGRITFHGHQVVGADMAGKALARLGYGERLTSQVSELIRYHMFEYMTQSGDTPIRRLVDRLGHDAVRDLLELRRADIVGSGGDCTAAWPMLKSLADELKQTVKPL